MIWGMKDTVAWEFYCATGVNAIAT